MAKHVKNLLIVANDAEIFSLKKKIESENVSFLKSQVRFVNSLYYAPKFHNSALGTDLRAAELFAWFTGQKLPDLKVVELDSERGVTYGVENSKPLPLHMYQEVYVSLDTVPIADFVTGLTEDYYGGLGEKFNFAKHKTVSLLSIGSLYDPLEAIHLRFLPLDYLLNENAPIALTFKLNGTVVRVPIGVAEGTSGVIGTLRMEKSDELIKRGANWSLRIHKGHMQLEANGSLDDLKLLMSDREILKLTLPLNITSVRGGIRLTIRPWDFSPLKGEWIYVRGNAVHSMDIEKIDVKDGNLNLVLQSKDGFSTRYPILPYTISPLKTVEFNLPNTALLIPPPEVPSR